MQDEEWRPIPGFTNYQASSHGRVRSSRRELKARTDPKGYKRLSLVDDDGRTRYTTAHQLVVLAFVGPRPEGQEVRHLDGDPGNNRIGNLRYGTRSENALDKRRHGTDQNATKTACPQGHPYDARNTYVNKDKRYCRTCGRARTVEWERRRALRAAGVAA